MWANMLTARIIVSAKDEAVGNTIRDGIIY
jgi:hypothetical protein